MAGFKFQDSLLHELILRNSLVLSSATTTSRIQVFYEYLQPPIHTIEAKSDAVVIKKTRSRLDAQPRRLPRRRVRVADTIILLLNHMSSE